MLLEVRDMPLPWMCVLVLEIPSTAARLVTPAQWKQIDGAGSNYGTAEYI